jgi:hypothetical protein
VYARGAKRNYGTESGPETGYMGAVRLVLLTGLRQKRSGRCNRSARQRLSDRTVARRYRHICARDICQRIAEEAEAVDRLISQRGALGQKSGGAAASGGVGTQLVSACGMFGLG